MNELYPAKYPSEESDDVYAAKLSLMKVSIILTDIIDAIAFQVLPEYVILSTKDPILRWTLVISYFREKVRDLEMSKALSFIKNIRNQLHHGKNVTSQNIVFYKKRLFVIYKKIQRDEKIERNFQRAFSAMNKVMEKLNLSYD